MKRPKPDLTTDPIASTLARLTWPMVFGMLGSVLYNLTDTYFLGKVGVDELAAMGYAFPAVMFVSSIAGGIGIGTASVFSRSVVTDRLTVVQSRAFYVMILSLVSVAVFIAAGLFTLEPLFAALGASSMIGLAGIFWAAFFSNLVAGILAWGWLQKLINGKIEPKPNNSASVQPAWHGDELSRREKLLSSNKEAFTDWNQAKEEIRKRVS